MSQRGERRLVAGMIGGGPRAIIGAAHRAAMHLDDRYVLAAGVFSRANETSVAWAAGLGVSPDRTYRDYQEMVALEAARPDGVDLVAICTPNDNHFEIASAFLGAGINVVCEKPLTLDSQSAAELVAIAEKAGAVLAVPHCYSAYPMIRHAARMVRNGDLGAITLVVAEHASGWAASRVESGDVPGVLQRMDLAIGGRYGVVGDIGTHAFHLMRYVTGLEAARVSADLASVVPGRRVIDQAFIRARLSNDAPAIVWASMVATGHAHGLRLRVYGEKASIEWAHEDPHHLIVRDLDATTTILTHGQSRLSEDAERLTRAGLGHPEGFLEAFANFYGDVADEVAARRDGRPSTIRELSYPDGVDGLIGVRFVEAVAASHENDGAWIRFPAMEA